MLACHNNQRSEPIMTNPQPRLLRHQNQPKQVPLPLDLPQKVQISTTEVWATLNLLQQSHLFHQLTKVCRSLLKPSHPEENENEQS
jgi:hypothetical protein